MALFVDEDLLALLSVLDEELALLASVTLSSAISDAGLLFPESVLLDLD